MDALGIFESYADHQGSWLSRQLNGVYSGGGDGGHWSDHWGGHWSGPGAGQSAAAPPLSLDLVDDTGVFEFDHVTSEPAVRVAVADDGSIAKLTAQLDGVGGARGAKDITNLIDADGEFILDRTALQGLGGRFGLNDGNHELTLVATDDRGRKTETTLQFVLDTRGPARATINLDAADDTGYRGDRRTETAIVDLVGQTEAFARIELDGIVTVADARGKFTLEDVRLGLGRHDYEVAITDRAGNESVTTLTLTRLENSVVKWNDVALEAIKATSTAPMYASRLLAMESVAIYEVVQAVEAHFLRPDMPFLGRFATIQEAAIAQASYDILTSVFASDTGPYRGSAQLRATLSAELAESLAEIPDGIGERRGVQLGHRIAQQILAERANDGWNAYVDPATEIGYDPGEWQPTGPGYASPLAPQWGDVAPWMVETSDQFMPGAPPPLDSEAWAEEYNLTKRVGGIDGEALGNRTADQTHLALFWADGAGTYTPPGHWNVIAGEVAQAEGRTTGEIAALYAKLNMALADAAITCWETKYTYDFWRPITAINLGDTDGNEATVADPDWKPLIATPPFPEYTSGHSTFSGAAAAILTMEFGASYAFTTGTPSTDPAITGTTRSFSSFWQAANEAGMSRIYGGIHFMSANLEGLLCGSQIADWVWQKFES